MEDKFLIKVIDSLTRGTGWPVGHQSNELIGDIKIGGCCGHVLVEFTVQRDMVHGKSVVTLPSFRKANLKLLVNKTPWKSAYRDKGIEQS